MAKKRAKQRTRVPVAYTSYLLLPHKKMSPLGKTNYNKKMISIAKRLQDYGQWSVTFWHEWMHAVTFENGYEFIADNEAFVESMGQAIMRFFTDPQGRLLIKGMLKHIKPK